MTTFAMSSATDGRGRDGSRLTCPYVGLVPFDEADEAYFFGRDRDRDLILANLTATRLTLLYAASGVGKSSVLRAAVVPQARRLAADTYEDLGVGGVAIAYVSDWSGAPAETIGQAALEAVARVPGAAPCSARVPARLSVEWLHEVVRAAHVQALYLVLDQFEEYFLYHADDRGDEGLVADVGEILRARDLRVNLLLAIREDALAGLDRFKGRIPHLFDNYLRLAPLDRAAGREAIEGPLARHNQLEPADGCITIEPGLVETLLDEVQVGRVAVVPDAPPAGEPVLRDPAAGANGHGRSAGGEIETPYLQLVLTRLWFEERAAGSDVLRTSTLQRLGGAETIVRTHLDQVMSALTSEQHEVAAGVFHHLVTSSGSKIALTAEDLAEWSGQSVTAVRDLMDSLCASRQRILRPVPPPVGHTGPVRYEIFHDIMGAAVLDWRRRHVAERTQAQASQRLIEEREEARAVAASARRHLRRVRLFAAGMALILLVVTTLGYFLYQRDREARRQRLLSEAGAALATDPALSLTKAVEADGIGGTEQTREAILAAATAPRGDVVWDTDAGLIDMVVTTGSTEDVVVYDARGRIRVVDGNGAVKAEAVADGLAGTVQYGSVASDGGRVALVTDRDEAVVVDVATGRTVALAVASPGLGPPALVASSTGALVVLPSSGQPTEIFDATTGALVTRLATPGYQAVASPDGAQVVTSDEDDHLRAWDAHAGTMVAETAQLSGPVWFLQPYGDKVVAVVGKLSEDGAGMKPEIAVWDWRSGSAPSVLPTNTTVREMQHVEVEQDDEFLLLAFDKTAATYSLRDGSSLGGLPSHADWVNDVQALTGGRWVMTAGGDGRIFVWSSYETNRPTIELAGHRGAVLRSVFLAGGTEVLSMGIDGTVRLWHLPTVERYDEHGDWVLGLDVSGDGRYLATASRDGNAVVLAADDLTRVDFVPALGVLTDVRFDPTEAHRLFTLSDFVTAPEQWQWKDDATYEKGPDFEPIPDATARWLTGFDISADGSTVVGGDSSGRLHLWDTTTGKLRPIELTAPGGAVTSVAFDPSRPSGPSGQRLAAANAEGVRVWALDDPAGAPVLLKAPNAFDVTFDPGGRLLAVTTGGGDFELWTADGRRIDETRPAKATRLGRAAFSDDGRLVAVGTAEGWVEVRDADTGRTVMLSRVHGDSVNSVRFAPGDNGHVLSASDDTTVARSECGACVDRDAVLDDARAWVRSAGDARHMGEAR